jgi:acetyl esterase/lipase
MAVLSPGLFAANAIEYRDVEYVRRGDVRLAFDAAIPQTPEPPPAVIVVHGGGWVRGDRRTDVEPLLQPLAEAGLAWFSISYRLMNDFTQFGLAIDDVAAAVRFVKTHAAEYRIDPGRIALVGESAGGQLAAMAALAQDPALRVQAFVGLYPPTDLEALAKNSKMVPQWIRDSVRGTAWEGILMARLKQLSPIEHVRRGMPPFLLIHGTADTLVPIEQSRAMCERAKAVGASCELYPVAGAGHGIRWWESTAQSNGYKRELARWLKDRLGSR